MGHRQPMTIQRLLDRLHAVRDRRDANARFSDAWYEADREMHAIERSIFRAPIEPVFEEEVDAGGAEMVRPLERRPRASEDGLTEPRYKQERAG